MPNPRRVHRLTLGHGGVVTSDSHNRRMGNSSCPVRRAAWISLVLIAAAGLWAEQGGGTWKLQACHACSPAVRLKHWSEAATERRLAFLLPSSLVGGQAGRQKQFTLRFGWLRESVGQERWARQPNRPQLPASTAGKRGSRLHNDNDINVMSLRSPQPKIWYDSSRRPSRTVLLMRSCPTHEGRTGPRMQCSTASAALCVRACVLALRQPVVRHLYVSRTLPTAAACPSCSFGLSAQ